MNNNQKPLATNPDCPSGSLQRLVLPLDLALTRWSVRCTTWTELSTGSAPLLGAFLAGWYCRCLGAVVEDAGHCRDSFRVGWKEADDFIQIEINKQNPNVKDES